MSSTKTASQTYLNLFFPIHYIVGIRIEDSLRCGVLTRQQTCILWTIRTQGQDGSMMRRKHIERSLSSWYELSSSEVSKALRALARPPLGLLTIVEDPASGREKLVSLTPEGKAFLKRMIANGVTLMEEMTAQMSEEEKKNGIQFLTHVTEIFQQLPESPPEKK